jgi:hypothetical protein
MSEKATRFLEEARELARQRRFRVIATALTLAAVAILLYVLTIVRLGGNVLNRAI